MFRWQWSRGGDRPGGAYAIAYVIHVWKRHGLLYRTRPHISRERQLSGQSAVELALCVPILLFVLLGASDLARRFPAEVAITNAAREGAFWGSLHTCNSSATTAKVLSAVGQASVGSNPNQVTSVTVATIPMTVNPPGGQLCQVTVSYAFSLVSPIPSGSLNLTLQGRATMLMR